ncbi:hypothetical protein SAMN02745124_01293 [Desulfofustis glycolicus DSM 9705]|uniref:Uncharacterized protein n=1 Tax=Desulfofustis glycolicus DSM 9705 TaxID=1121409 RepID=A0A1M5UP36_9BACT|nr:hypothetical protein SAMN02745124_01293 [Desulfofustis glycolicus DSM 9705]
MRKPVLWLIVLLIGTDLAGQIRQPTRPEPGPVSIKPVVRGTLEEMVPNTRVGSVEACRRARLSPSIGGRMVQLPQMAGVEPVIQSLGRRSGPLNLPGYTISDCLINTAPVLKHSFQHRF